jgi:hypothetical protein
VIRHDGPSDQLWALLVQIDSAATILLRLRTTSHSSTAAPAAKRGATHSLHLEVLGRSL